MKALAQSQDKIGYRNFMEGYISIHFYEIQNFHLSMSSSFLNGIGLNNLSQKFST